jgi:hypothetical protein
MAIAGIPHQRALRALEKALNANTMAVIVRGAA